MDLEQSILNKKLELIQWLSTVKYIAAIEKIIELRKVENKDWWNSISADEKSAIEQGLNEANAGKLNPHSKARKLYEKWL